MGVPGAGDLQENPTPGGQKTRCQPWLLTLYDNPSSLTQAQCRHIMVVAFEPLKLLKCFLFCILWSKKPGAFYW